MLCAAASLTYGQPKFADERAILIFKAVRRLQYRV